MIRVEARGPRSQMPEIRRAFEQQLQAKALSMTDRAATRAKTKLRERSGGWSASGWIFIRSASERTRGAIEAYTQGATILPRNPSGLLWYPTDDIMRMARVPLPSSGGSARGNVRLTPKLWGRTYAQRFGPLVRLRLNGRDVLVVKNATLSLAGKPRSIKPLTRRGKVPRGQVQREFVIAFIGIRSTTRVARVNPAQTVRNAIIEMSRGSGSGSGA
jgi:hypothetical protein